MVLRIIKNIPFSLKKNPVERVMEKEKWCLFIILGFQIIKLGFLSLQSVLITSSLK